MALEGRPRGKRLAAETRRAPADAVARLLHFFPLPLLAFAKALRDRRSPGDQRGLVGEALREVGVIVLHDIEHGFLGKPSMMIGKQFVQVSELFVVHGFRASVAKYTATC
jgi:hypothetical protein